MVDPASDKRENENHNHIVDEGAEDHSEVTKLITATPQKLNFESQLRAKSTS